MPGVFTLTFNKQTSFPVRDPQCIPQTMALRGLEVDIVFLTHLQKTFLKEDEEDIAAERRILYMAMSRAREKLYMSYFGKLPCPYEDLRRKSLADFVG